MITLGIWNKLAEKLNKKTMKKDKYISNRLVFIEDISKNKNTPINNSVNNPYSYSLYPHWPFEIETIIDYKAYIHCSLDCAETTTSCGQLFYTNNSSPKLVSDSNAFVNCPACIRATELFLLMSLEKFKIIYSLLMVKARQTKNT